MMMFEQLFGEAYASSNGLAQRPFNDNTQFLTDFAERCSVLSIYHILQDEFKNAADIDDRQAAESFAMRRAGNNHFMIGRYTDAVEAYKRALELQPGDAKLYTNIALALIRCGRYEEAVSYAHGACVVDPLFSKAFALMAVGYAHLGYTDAATFYCGDCLKPFGMDVSMECERVIGNSIHGKVDASMYRQTTAQDLQMTLNRFSDPYLNVDQLIYLFVHLDFHVSCKDQNTMMQVGNKLRQIGFIRRLFRDIRLTSDVIMRPDLLSLSSEDAHLLASCLRIVGFAACGSPQACNDLLSCEEFRHFLSVACRQIVSEKFIKTVLSDRSRYAFHILIVENLLRTLCTATSQGSPFHRHLRAIEPFNRFSWHVKLLGVWYAFFNPLKTADLMCHLVVSVSKICEEFEPFLDELSSMPKRDAIALFSLLATVSQIFVECAIHSAVPQPIQLDLLLVFWLHLTKDYRSVMICVQSPRIWTFLVNRLRFVANNVNATSLSGEIWFLLECLCNMAAFIKKNPQASEHCFENGPWFEQLVDACSEVCWKTSKHHVPIRSALMLASRLSSFSPRFGEAFAQRVTYTRLVRLASSGEPDVDAPALNCLATLLNNRCTPDIIKEILSSTHLNEYIAKMISSIAHAVNPLAALGNDSKSCLYFLIDDRNGEEIKKTSREALLNILKKSNSDAFSKKLQGSETGTDGAAGPVFNPPKRKKDGDMFSEPLPDDVSSSEAAHLSSRLFEALIKVDDELGNLLKPIPA